jgi:hypothetical protein
MQTFFTKLATILAAPFLFIGSILNPVPDQAPVPVGAALPQAVGVFETTLAAPISSSATSLTLTANAIRGGGAISGYNCFTVDEGSAQAEVICGTVSTLSVTSLERGISYSTGTTTVAGNQFSHRRGANIKITDFPIIQRLKAQNNGEDTFENPIKYASTVSTSTLGLDGKNLASVEYANELSFGTVAGASETAAGFVELATTAEIASSTQTGSTGARLGLSTANATSTKPTTGGYIPITGSDGGLGGFINNQTITSVTLAGTTTITGAVLPLPTVRTYNLADSPATWTKPTGLHYIIVELWGAGGSGGSNGGGGGGGGAYNSKLILASVLSATTSITIGAGGTASTNANGKVGANSSFGSIITAYGGGGGGGFGNNAGGGGGGITSVGSLGSSIGGNGGSPGGSAGGNAAVGVSNSGFGGAGGADSTFAGGSAYYGGGGGGGDNSGGIGGSSVYGGGGGGGGDFNSVSGGTSIYGGNGGNGGDDSPVPTAGAVPGGGGGAGRTSTDASGAGGAGRVIVTEYYI